SAWPSCATHVNLIAGDFVAAFDVQSANLNRFLFALETCRYVKQAEALCLWDCGLDAFGILQFLAQHLVTAAYAHNREASLMAPLDISLKACRSYKPEAGHPPFSPGQFQR